jgi:rhodanese-related sulfurtransferase
MVRLSSKIQAEICAGTSSKPSANGPGYEVGREPALRDRARPIITVCELGPMGALGGKLLKDMGFANVSILEGGTQAWKDAGFPTKQI